MKNVHSCDSKCTNIKNDDNKQNGISLHIYTIGYRYLQKNYKIINKNNLDESKKEKIE